MGRGGPAGGAIPGCELKIKLLAPWEALPLLIAGLGVFPGGPPVVWAAPAVTVRLLSLHDSLCTALAPFPVHPHYRPGSWVPHVTLSQAGVTTAARAVEIAMSAWDGPIEGRLDRVELVRFRPVSVLWGCALQPSGTG
ncbi:2'-5' RNA ligase family protein [Muricoccus radiodurans]|uniref:2'-5' RNA ligase family protein n=1 Tax=Muricoccus radiodurans TaxID=2231721 RepID=UPI003CEB3B92